MQHGDTIEFLAPASKYNPEILPQLQKVMEGWGFKAKFSCPLSEEDWLCSAPEKIRWKSLEEALLNEESQAIWAVAGGHGCTHLLPYLMKMPKPAKSKLLMGFSDVTVLHLFVNQVWGWPSLHCASGRQVSLSLVCEESLRRLKEALSGKVDQPFDAPVVGGNLSLVTSTLGTPWQIKTKNKYLFLEEIGERAYRIDRMLFQLQAAGCFEEIKGIIFGDFIQRDSFLMDDQTKTLINEWKAKLSCPTYYYPAGHGNKNYPLWLFFK